MQSCDAISVMITHAKENKAAGTTVLYTCTVSRAGGNGAAGTAMAIPLFCLKKWRTKTNTP